jgi:hypothetical protein
MKRWAILFIFACWAGCFLFAFDWPLERIVLTATFGEHRGDHFHAGIDLGGGEQLVFPISPGELVFSHSDKDYSSIPIGLGNFVVLQHQGGIRSLYAHLADGSVDAGRKVYDGRTSLGTVGSSGYSSGKHLHLTIVDTEMGTIINPLLLLPPLADRQAPEIREVYVQSGQELVRLQDGVTSLRSGAEASLFANVYDVREDVSFLWKLAPYKVFLSQDGREISAFTFDSLHGVSNPAGIPELVLTNTGKAFDEVYQSPWVLSLGRINLVQGETILTVFASDFSGNESSREYALSVLE